MSEEQEEDDDKEGEDEDVFTSPFFSSGFGEDDFRVSMRYGIVKKDEPAICPVDPSGRFTDVVADFKGLHVKEADKHIVKMLKEKTKMVKQGRLRRFHLFLWTMACFQNKNFLDDLFWMRSCISRGCVPQSVCYA